MLAMFCSMPCNLHARLHLMPESVLANALTHCTPITVTLLGLLTEAHEAELLGELPRHMRGRIVAHLLQDVFQSSELFSHLEGAALAMLAASLRPRAVLPGHDLCRAGDPADCMWILQSGGHAWGTEGSGIQGVRGGHQLSHGVVRALLTT